MNDSALLDASTATAHSAPATLILLPPLSESSRADLAARLLAANGGQPLRLRTPDPVENTDVLKHMETGRDDHGDDDGWLLTLRDYSDAATRLREEGGAAVLLLGPEAPSLSDDSLLRMLQAAAEPRADISVPRYELSPQASLVNAAMLYPLTCALYGIPARFPLPLDVVLTSKAAESLGRQQRRPAGAGSAIFWPIAEAVADKLTVAEFACGSRQVPAPPAADLQGALADVVGSLFADAESKAAVWQRVRGDARLLVAPALENSGASRDTSQSEVGELIDNFRHAYTNLHDLWSLVLPPQSLLQLKRLSQAPLDSFRMADELWARIVYDFLLAYRLRTMNGGHLLGAITPLYLAWVASHLQQCGGDAVAAEAHINAMARAFIVDKPYLVSRWRWPDRFNP